MNAKQKIHHANLLKWTALFKEQADSGLSIREWCNQNNLSIHKYNYWKHQAKESYIDSILPDIVPLSPAPINQPIPGSTTNLTYQSCDSHNSCNSLDRHSIIVSIGDIRIEIGSSASDDMISGIIKAVRHA